MLARSEKQPPVAISIHSLPLAEKLCLVQKDGRGICSNSLARPMRRSGKWGRFSIGSRRKDLTGASLVVRSPSRQPLDRLTGNVARGTDAAAGTASIEETVVFQNAPGPGSRRW